MLFAAQDPATQTWLDVHSGAVQAVLAFILIAITACYAWLTKSLVKQAETSADAAKRSADAAEKMIAFMKLQHEEQRGLGPQIVAEAIRDTKQLIRSWKHEASAHMPDPQALTNTKLEAAIPHARAISKELADYLADASTELRSARQQKEKTRLAAKSGFLQLLTDAAQRADAHLNAADELLDKALKLLA